MALAGEPPHRTYITAAWDWTTDVYAVGDVTSVGTPKAGVFAEGQAAVVADRISARIRGTPEYAQYEGRGMCYLEFGHDQVAIVDVTFLSGQPPVGGLQGPSRRLPRTRSTLGPAGSSGGLVAPGPWPNNHWP
jgi:NADPH-dependent 2,4-dienoyl-CoA reductase/sulfur reductase-like enzyme